MLKIGSGYTVKYCPMKWIRKKKRRKRPSNTHCCPPTENLPSALRITAMYQRCMPPLYSQTLAFNALHVAPGCILSVYTVYLSEQQIPFKCSKGARRGPPFLAACSLGGRSSQAHKTTQPGEHLSYGAPTAFLGPHTSTPALNELFTETVSDPHPVLMGRIEAALLGHYLLVLAAASARPHE